MTRTGPPCDSRVRTVFLGSGHFGVESLWHLVDDPAVELVGVVTSPPRPAGRRQALTPTDIGAAAEELGIRTILAPPRLRAVSAVRSVLALRPELAVLADYGQLVPPTLLGLRHGALNLHPSLLPRHRGASPIPATILAGDTETGVTLMRMDEGLDTGPIIAQRRVPLAGTETAPLLEETLEMTAEALLRESLGPWLRGELTARSQPTEGATMTRPLHREDGRLDPTRPAVELERQVRAFQPWPGSFLDTDVGRMAVWEADVGRAADRPPGRFGSAGLSTAAGELLLRQVQPAGGRRMSWDAFVRGRPAIVGSAVIQDR